MAGGNHRSWTASYNKLQNKILSERDENRDVKDIDFHRFFNFWLGQT